MPVLSHAVTAEDLPGIALQSKALRRNDGPKRNCDTSSRIYPLPRFAGRLMKPVRASESALALFDYWQRDFHTII